MPRSLPGAGDLYPGGDDDWLARGNTTYGSGLSFRDPDNIALELFDAPS